MAKLKENSNYYSGKVGAVVECQWKGIRYIRSLPSYVNDPKTPAQLTQRSKFKAAHRFVKAMLCTIKVGYAAFAVRQTAYNACLSHTLKQAAVGNYPDVTLDYSKALLGEGALAVPENAEIHRTENQLTISWNAAKPKGNGSASDTTIIALYCVERNQALQIFDSAQRADGKATVNTPAEWQDCTIQCFMGFRYIESKNISNIGHIGQTGRAATIVSELEVLNKTMPIEEVMTFQLQRSETTEEPLLEDIYEKTDIVLQQSENRRAAWESICNEVKKTPIRWSRFEGYIDMKKKNTKRIEKH